MNGVEAMRSAFHAARHWFSGTMADVTEDQAQFVPPGRAHNIAALAAHVEQAEDFLINGLLQGRPPIWESEGWEGRLGIPNFAMLQEGSAVPIRGSVEAMRPYSEAVHAATQRYLDSLTDDDLDREVDMSSFGMGPMRLGDVLTSFTVGNMLAHTGEISAMKGIQGAQGYPF